MDMSALKYLKNPWVLGAGVGLGLVVLAMRGGGQAGGVDGYAGDQAYINAINNQGNAVINANAQVEVAKAQAGAVNIASIIAWITNSQQISASQQVQNNQIMAGVQQTQIVSMNSYLTELSDNLTRMAQTYVAGDVANRQTAAQIEMTRIQAGAATEIAETQADASKFGAVVGGISNIAGGALKLFGAH